MDKIKTNTLSFRFPPFLKHFEYFFNFELLPQDEKVHLKIKNFIEIA